MFLPNNTIPRRGFLGKIAAGAAAAGAVALVSPLKAAAATLHDAPPASPDLAGFEPWLAKITGKHKQVFDAPAHRDGLPLAWTRVFLSTNNDLGTPDAELSAVIIFRHDGIPAAMEDRLWAKYNFGDLFKVTDGATKAPSVRNPWYNPKPGELPFPDMDIASMQKRGVLMGVCDMALTFYSMGVGKKMNVDPADVKKDWISGLLPGFQLVPSGVLAVNRAQEHGCTYCFAG